VHRLQIAPLGAAALFLALASTAAANGLSVSAAAALGPASSQWGLRIDLVDAPGQRNPAWVVAGPAEGFSDETTLAGTFFVDPQNVTMSTTPGVNSFQMIDFLDGVGPGGRVWLIFHLNRTAGGYFINVWHWNRNLSGGSGGFQFSGGNFLALANNANWHNNRVDFEWTAGDPGHLTLWRTRYLGGEPDASGTIEMFSVDLPGMQDATINYVFAGMFTSHDPGTSGPLFLDEFSFHR